MKNFVLPIAVLGIIASMLLPISPTTIDVLLVINLVFSVLLLLTSLFLQQPLRLSSLPGILLLATLLRLALNVSTTKLILGKGDAGNLILAFGEMMTQGNVLVAFATLIIANR